ncbi:MAG: mechanosensitive ion channel family protein [Betaproteobacteria bacterium]|nr:mechanosensitive ion channel family protein [Betaproteobacteria bacterium]
MDTPFLDAISSISTREWVGYGQSAVRVVLIAIAAWLVVAIGNRAIRTMRTRLQQRAPSEDRAKRLETLGRVFRYVLGVVVSVVAGMLILNELGISVAPVLATAGVAGIAVGFGAQSLIKDYFNGFFLLVDDQLGKGDIVIVAGIGGLVEDLTLRYVRLRDYDGNVHFVPNGQISTVSNLTRNFAFAVMDIGIAYRENVEEAIDVIREVGREMRADESFGPRILEDLEIAGVDKWADSAVVIRCRFKVKPIEQWGVRRGFLQRLKAAFDARDIEIPYPHLTVYAGEPKQGTAPAFILRGLPGSAQ